MAAAVVDRGWLVRGGVVHRRVNLVMNLVVDGLLLVRSSRFRETNEQCNGWLTKLPTGIHLNQKARSSGEDYQLPLLKLIGIWNPQSCFCTV